MFSYFVASTLAFVPVDVDPTRTPRAWTGKPERIAAILDSVLTLLDRFLGSEVHLLCDAKNLPGP